MPQDLHPGLVDVHTHAVAPDLTAPGPGRWATVERTAHDRARMMLDGRVYREIDDRCWSAERRLADMDAEGVAAQFVSPIPVTLAHDQPADGAAAVAAAQNEFLADLCAAAPGRLFALGAVPLQDVDRAVVELRRCVLDRGFLGVEIGTVVGGRELADPEFAPFFAAAAELGALVLVHPVDQTLDPRLVALGLGFGLGMPTETAVAGAGLLTRSAPRPAGAHICLAHGGGTLPAALPRLDRGVAMADPDATPPSIRARHLWCDSLTYDPAALLLAVARFGAEHVLLGTDYPFAAREDPAGAVLAGLEPALRAAIGRENALAVLRAVAYAVSNPEGATP